MQKLIKVYLLFLCLIILWLIFKPQYSTIGESEKLRIKNQTRTNILIVSNMIDNFISLKNGEKNELIKNFDKLKNFNYILKELRKIDEKYSCKPINIKTRKEVAIININRDPSNENNYLNHKIESGSILYFIEVKNNKIYFRIYGVSENGFILNDKNDKIYYKEIIFSPTLSSS